MSLSIGVRLGTYEILALIGTGGMGEVYRARDTRLGRDVAIKVLPASVAGDAERRARFEREARILAALNHPNIAAIFGAEDAGGARALIMELVEGPTLQDVIASSSQTAGMSLDDSLPIARQIAEALEAAHRAGVVHRDLKPANIKVRSDGTVKVLDFGLAKALAAAQDPSLGAEGDLANSPTITSPVMTQQGVIFGTAAYMSPEQARGKPVDKRADLWAFGCVLFEMLTGRRAFTGDTVTDVLASVVRAEPDWAALPTDTPRPIRTLLRRCLKKDAAQRLADASAARLEIDDARSEPRDAERQPSPVRSRGHQRLAWAVTTAMTIVAAVAVAFVLRRPAPSTTVGPQVRFEMDVAADGVVSPDGTAILYPARTGNTESWFIRTLASGASRPLPGMNAVYNAFWSPDGRAIAFLAEQKLKRIEVAAGTVQTLADAPTPRGGSWGPDGTILFSPGGNGPIYRISATGGIPEPVTELSQPQASHRHPIWLPDGRHFLFYVLGPAGARGQYLASLGDKRTTRLLDTDGPGAFADPDRVLFFREGVLYVQRLDLANARMIADAVPVASGFQINETAGPRVSASRTGVITFMIDPDVPVQIQWIDRTGKPLQKIGEPVTNVIDGALSPDGRTIALARLEKSDTFLWLMDVSRGTLSRFTNGNRPVWSPDSTRIGFNSGRDGFGRIYWQRVGVSAPAELVFKSRKAQNMVDWSHEGDRLVFSSQSADNARDLWIVPIAGADRTPTPIVQTKAEERGGSISPDGKWFAYESDETGPMAIFVRRFPNGERAWRVSTGDGTAPSWRADSHELYYRTEGRLMAVRFDSTGDSASLGAPVALFPLQSAGAPPLLPLRSITDGMRFLAAIVTAKVVPSPRMTVIVNLAGT